MNGTATRKLASDKQVAFIARLVAERDIEALTGTAYERAFDIATGAGKYLSGAEARVTIDALLAAPRVNEPADPPEGAHYLDGAVYRVKTSQSSGKAYATQLIASGADTDAARAGLVTVGTGKAATFEYVGRGPLARLSDATLLTLEQAKAWGVRMGICAVCGAALRVPASVEAGIGPVCAKRVA